MRDSWPAYVVPWLSRESDCSDSRGSLAHRAENHPVSGALDSEPMFSLPCDCANVGCDRRSAIFCPFVQRPDVLCHNQVSFFLLSHILNRLCSLWRRVSKTKHYAVAPHMTPLVVDSSCARGDLTACTDTCVVRTIPFMPADKNSISPDLLNVDQGSTCSVAVSFLSENMHFRVRRSLFGHILDYGTPEVVLSTRPSVPSTTLHIALLVVRLCPVRDGSFSTCKVLPDPHFEGGKPKIRLIRMHVDVTNHLD